MELALEAAVSLEVGMRPLLRERGGKGRGGEREREMMGEEEEKE